MLKLFITIYFLLIISVFSIVIGTALIPTATFQLIDSIEIERKISQGTFTLLDQSINNLSDEQITLKLAHYKLLFPKGFELIDISSIQLTTEEKKAFDQGKSISREVPITTEMNSSDENTLTTLYHQSKQDTSKVWKIIFDADVSMNNLTITVTGERYIHAVFALIEEQLLMRDQQEWVEMMPDLKRIHGFNLRLIKRDSLPLNKKVMALIEQGRSANRTQTQRVATFIYPLKGSSYLLEFGPITIPWGIYYLGYIFFLSLALVIALISMVWVWPVWRDLVKIKSAADEFGEGLYDTRIPAQKFSLLSKISTAFNLMAERTQRSIESHKELTNAVSHELRTPLARMRFSLEMLISTDNKKNQTRHANDITEDIDELELLLSELLTYARFERDSGKINYQSQALIPWFNKTLHRLETLAKHKQLDYIISDINDTETTLFEPRLMSRMLDNLVQNALRYANKRIKVTLSKEQQYYQLTVEDDGIGIAETERERLFDVFSRIDSSRDRDTGGFGLGLAIVKRIAEGHQGYVLIKDSPLGGALFEVQWLIQKHHKK
ncbi:MAG: ATP-binding protein [Cocleimonas sp.]|nr:ATP-binding protein [Cocleimonas sp.]